MSGCGGHVYPFAVSAEVELRASSPVQATRYDREVLRCSSSLMTFTAPLPAEATDGKYDASVAAAVALMCFELGVPHHRLARWRSWAGLPQGPSWPARASSA